MGKLTLTEMESSALRMLLAGDLESLSLLRDQLEACQVEWREMSGTGFFTGLRVDPSVAPAPAFGEKFWIRHVSGRVDGLQYGAGFMVLVTDGYLNILEGFSYEEPWPEGGAAFSLFYEFARADNPAEIAGLDEAQS